MPLSHKQAHILIIDIIDTPLKGLFSDTKLQTHKLTVLLLHLVLINFIETHY